MTNKKIAELTTKIVVAVASNPNKSIDLEKTLSSYKEIFKTIKSLDQENEPAPK